MTVNTTLCCSLYSELSCKQLWLVHCDFVQEDSNLHFKGHDLCRSVWPVQVTAAGSSCSCDVGELGWYAAVACLCLLLNTGATLTLD